MNINTLLICVFLVKCRDTPNWNNGNSVFTCSVYEANYCKDGGFLPGSEWVGGQTYNFPENNCCACGKSNNFSQTHK